MCQRDFVRKHKSHDKFVMNIEMKQKIKSISRNTKTNL